MKHAFQPSGGGKNDSCWIKFDVGVHSVVRSHQNSAKTSPKATSESAFSSYIKESSPPTFIKTFCKKVIFEKKVIFKKSENDANRTIHNFGTPRNF